MIGWKKSCLAMTPNLFICAIQKSEVVQNNELKNKIIRNIDLGMSNNMLSNNDLINIIETSGSYLNLMTISDYAKENNISYNGAKHFREHLELFGVKFIVDNI